MTRAPFARPSRVRVPKRKGLTKWQLLQAVSETDDEHVITRHEMDRIFDTYSDERLFIDHKGMITRMT